MDTQDLFLQIGREFHLTYDQVSKICDQLLERFQEITLSTREQIERDVRGILRWEHEEVGRAYLSRWLMVKEDDGDYVLFDEVIAAIAGGK